MDFNKFRAGLETCENLIPLSEGGAMRRSGSRFIAEEKSSSVKGRLKRFMFNVVQAYVVEMGDSVLRFYRHQGQITVPDIANTITNGEFTDDISTWDDQSTGGGSISHDATNGRLNLIPGGTGASDIGIAGQDINITPPRVAHVIKFRVLGAPGDKAEVRIGAVGGNSEMFGPADKEVGWHCIEFDPGGSEAPTIQFRNYGSFRNKTVQIDDVVMLDDQGVEIDSPWAEAELFDVEGPQSADVLYLFHDATPTYKLQRFGHRTWSLVEVPWVDGPYLDENTTATTLLPSASTGLGINLTLSSINGVNNNQGWLSTDIGRLVRYKETTTWGYAVIVSITSTTVAVADVRKDFESTPTAKTTWQIGAWSGEQGYPQAAVFFEQRLYVAATDEQPQTFWASQTADFENFKPDNQDVGETGAVAIEDDDALTFTLSADDVNAIRWLSAGEDTLVIGTHGGEWVPESTGEVITPNDITVRRQTTHGSSRVQPVRVGNSVLFVQRAKRRIREFGLAFAESGTSLGFRAPDVTRLAHHVTKGGIIEMDFAEEAESILWAVRDDGQLLSVTFKRDEDVVGWARHILGGQILNDTAAFSKVWQVDDSAGQRIDETLDANDTGNADWQLFPAQNNKGLSFSGDNNPVNRDADRVVLSTPINIPGDLEIETTILPQGSIGTVGAPGQLIVREGIASDDEQYGLFWNATDERAIFGWYDGVFNTVTSTLGSVPLNKETTISVIRAGTTLTFTINGTVDTITTVTTPTGTPAEMDVGDHSTIGQAFRGIIRYVNIWSDVTRTTLELSWLFEDGSGTNANDSSINNRDGTLTAHGASGVLPLWQIDSPAVGDSAELAHPKPFAQITFDYANGTAGIGGVVTWEYERAEDAWAAFDGVTDNTTGFTAAVADSLTVSWTLPTDWVATDGLFHARARITTTYTTDPILDQGFIQGVEDPVVESVAVIPGANGSGQTKDSTGRDEVWISVRRTIDGSTKRYIEVFEIAFETGDDQEDAYYVDSVITYDSTPATVLTGYDHIDNEDVKIWADGAIQAGKTISSTGGLTIDTAASVVQAGLAFKHKLKTLKVSAGNPAGTPLGKTKRVYGLTFALLNSHTLGFGPSSDKLTSKDFRVVSNPMDAAAPLFTGEQFVEFAGDWGGDARIVIESDDPAPFTLLAMAPEITHNPLK